MSDLSSYYINSEVRKRIAEYCGGKAEDFSSFTAATLAGYGAQAGWVGKDQEDFGLIPQAGGFDQILNNGLDIFRSNWDKLNSLSILDIEYFNMDYPGEIYLNSLRTFNKLEIIYRTTLSIFYKFNIVPLVIMTGQGYHFSCCLPQNSKVHKRVEEIGTIAPSLERKYLNLEERSNGAFSISQGKAFDGIGRLMEYLLHLIIKKIGMKGMPVVCTDLAVNNGKCGREAVSLDLSMYGDPLYSRHIRCPFSAYQKHKAQRDRVGVSASQIPIQIALPRLEHMSLEEICEIREDFSKAKEYAISVNTKIPDASVGYDNLIRSYKRSQLYQFHKYFDSEEHDHPSEWEQTYDRLYLDKLPPCISHALIVPNDNLLKPTNIQAITRVLLKKGWHPKHIAGLIRSKYDKNYNWGNIWSDYDTSTRANFYVRLFSGLLSDGVDNENDLNCVSHHKKGYCWKPWCGHNLEDYKKQ